jgi:hypothetical protein
MTRVVTSTVKILTPKIFIKGRPDSNQIKDKAFQKNKK